MRNLRTVTVSLVIGTTAAILSAAAQSRPPLTPTDVDAIARIIMLEDSRQFDEPALEALLKASHPEVRRRAIVAVGRIVNPRGAALMAGLRAERDPVLLAAVAFATGQIRDNDAVAWLGQIMAASSTPPVVAREAARSLGKIRTPEARVALSQYAATAPATSAAAPIVGEALLSLGRFTGRDDVVPIVRWASSRDVEIRWRATWALFRLRHPEGVPALMRLAADPSPEVRYWAVRGLAPTVVDDATGVDRAAASALLTRATRDGDRRVRTEALRALAAYGDDAAFKAVLDALDSNDTWLSVSAAESITQFKDRVPDLLPRLRAATDTSRPMSLRMTALTPLLAFAPDAAREVATELAASTSPVIRAAGRTALSRLDAAAAAAKSASNAAGQTPATPPAARGSGARGSGPPAPPAAPPARPLAEYRAIVERWVVPDYRGARRPRTVWETPRGTIEIELNPGDVPLGVDYLVKVVESGDIVGTEFGRVVPNFVAQQQAIRNAARLRDEVNQQGLLRATLSWASSGLDTGRPGYTLGNTPQPHNEGNFTALGRVIRGMDAVDRLELGDAVTATRMQK